MERKNFDIEGEKWAKFVSFVGHGRASAGLRELIEAFIKAKEASLAKPAEEKGLIVGLEETAALEARKISTEKKRQEVNALLKGYSETHKDELEALREKAKTLPCKW